MVVEISLRQDNSSHNITENHGGRGLFSYSAFNLSVQSNLPIPGLVPIDTSLCADVTIHAGIPAEAVTKVVPSEPRQMWDVSTYCDDGGVPVRRILRLATGSFFKIEYCDGVEFWVDRDGTEIWTCWPDSLSIHDMASYLLGPVLGMLLRLRGTTCLHASAISLNDVGAIAFVGAQGAGKSTLAALMVHEGYAALSDDVVGMVEREGAPSVLPAYPHLCIWPDAAKLIYGDNAELPRFIPNWEKRRLPLDHGELRFDTRTLRLRKIYLLGDRCEGSSPQFEEISPRAALIGLVRNTYAPYMLDVPMRAVEFESLARIRALVPVIRLRVPEGLAGSGELCEAIRANASGGER